MQVFILSLGPIDDRSNVSKICFKAEKILLQNFIFMLQLL